VSDCAILYIFCWFSWLTFENGDTAFGTDVTGCYAYCFVFFGLF